MECGMVSWFGWFKIDISNFLMVFFVVWCFLFLFLLVSCVKLSFFFFVEWDFLFFSVSVYFSNFMFSLILLLMTTSVLVFSTYYLNGESNFNYHYFMLPVFVCSMFSLIYGNSCFSMLISWDLLGISSLFWFCFMVIEMHVKGGGVGESA